ncbi:MAG TPA: phosphoglycerate kinase [Candidatus Acidoferrales bacterium]|nr:phosphoglycerate kinase [Candidatus Acidoferrales bacterium]
MRFLTLRDVDVSSKRVLVREDLNVPLKDGKVADETRIDASLETLRHLRRNDARIVIMSHLGRPDGKRDPKLSLKPVAERLGAKLGVTVKFADDCVGRPVEALTQALKDGEVLLLENLRFHREEEANDAMFARLLAKNGDIYVNDAFGTAHRAHASTEGIAHLMPAVAGFLMQKELDALGRLVDEPAQPFVCAIGGAKVHDKVAVFDFLVERVSAFVIGGGMANTFLAAKGFNIGKSLRDPDLSHAKNIVTVAGQRGIPLHLPTDVVVADSFDADDTAQIVSLEEIGERMILDIGPETGKAYAEVLAAAKTIVFNGPMGVYEKGKYQAGTRAILEAIVQATKGGATSVVGGGDAAAAAHMLGFDQGVTHVSTGGGATLEFLEGKSLPGVAALEQAAEAKR